MLYYVEITGTGILGQLFNKTEDKTVSDKLYIKAVDIESALKKAHKYLQENNASHLKIREITQLNGKLL